MKRRWFPISAWALLFLTTIAVPPARALEEADRLWLVGEHAFADGLYPLARRVLERFVSQYGSDPRLPDAVLLLGKARLALGDSEAALEAFRRAQTWTEPPARALEAKFWEGEALYRLKRFAEARTAYDTVLRRDAAASIAPDALYGLAWSELELKRGEAAVTAFQELLRTWPEHALAPSATFYLARTLADLGRGNEALPLLESFRTKYPGHKLAADAQYLLGRTRVTTGDPRGGVAILKEFVAGHPDHAQAPAARKLIVDTLARFGDREELQEAYRALLQQSPPTAEGLYDAGNIATRLGRPRDRDAAWQKLRTQFPEHQLTHRAELELANAAFKRKDWKTATSLAGAAAKSAEDGVRAEALLLAGESDLKLRRFAPAVKAFEAVTAIKDVEAGVRYRALAGVGLAREELQQWREALAAYESVASRSPDATLRDWARERANAVKARLGRDGGEKKPGGRS